MKTIRSCRACQSKKIIKFLDLERHPLANSLLNNLKIKEKQYPLSLSFCSNCSLVQLNQTINPKELFSYYVWLTATSKTACAQAEIFCQQVLSRLNNLNKSYVLEIASNDGTFLKPFKKRGYNVLGIDPAKNIVNIAVKNKIPTECHFFGAVSAKKILKKHGAAKVIIARNVLAHVADLHDFVNGLSICLADNGVLAVEFHYAKKIFEELQYDSIYHEHLCYFSLKSAQYLFQQHGFYIFDIKESPISGGALILFLKKIKTKESKAVESFSYQEKEIKLNQLNSWKKFAKRIVQHRKSLRNILEDVARKNYQVIGYGASARSSTLLNYCKINSKLISMIADQNPLKKGKYTSGSHIPIVTPEQAMRTEPQYILILAWNFTEEIIKILKHKFCFKGNYILPLPNKPKIINEN